MKIRNITFMDRSQAVILCCKLSALPIKEECILRKSLEFFSDPEPCFIHRSAVMTRILAETDEYLHNLAKDGIWEIRWAAFPEKFREMLDIGKETESIRFTG